MVLHATNGQISCFNISCGAVVAVLFYDMERNYRTRANSSRTQKVVPRLLFEFARIVAACKLWFYTALMVKRAVSILYAVVASSTTRWQ